MPLHRDIHWLGRQWAVTGYGLQLISQKPNGAFDIEIAHLWHEPLLATVQAQAWLDKADFDKALELARTRFADAQTTSDAATNSDPVLPLIKSILAEPPQKPRPRAEPKPARAVNGSVAKAAEPVAPQPAPRKLAIVEFRLKGAGSARFVRPWRVMLKR
ncbi:hypothetical protein JQ604_38830 [Bradyrhizobium jicamae]|uniref:hypothetical protein n=1 Tax=Bradyrhizobium jicamae TaxID=280332 RepID=UPI001BAD3E90|nr:hypothetical protein [Bradyrhizobium jicamae]MBR0758172.1 hypothetical protein [Bradyrhizobium jicamae]